MQEEYIAENDVRTGSSRLLTIRRPAEKVLRNDRMSYAASSPGSVRELACAMYSRPTN
jgi:hypothetical protein